MGRLRKFLDLSRQDQYLLAESVLLLGAIKVGLSVLPFRTIRRFVTSHSRAIGAASRAEPSVKRVVWALEVVTAYLPLFKNCLNRALAAHVLLGRRGYDPKLRIGVLRNEDRLEAHAWIESEGRIVVGRVPELATYTKLPPLENGSL